MISFSIDEDDTNAAPNPKLTAVLIPSIEKEIKLKQIKILKIESLNINRQLSIISNPECYKSKAFHLFYKELIRLKSKSQT